jgi:hypothetical protein
MTKDRLCDYGNCEKTRVAVTVNYHNEERPAFCCGEHAALWLLQRSNNNLGKITLSEMDWIAEKFAS